ncbi:hypothetical protein HELRODRAFT_173323 [Helobdella robusta]|uniref:Uncharacterized protein n=1 Tax=Helobdella robusta TaxID=6412 RepID=T1F6P1_HELRO|nr:hypothetical protein HELRODRAFT_173323 [Helobdella robusta]ESO03629.1 hypothetical protein HELRODRAFT_173323 [Helobdella robusta]
MGCTPFHWVCFCGSVELVRCFIDLLLFSVADGSLNEPSQNSDGQRPIHWAVYKDMRRPLHHACLNGALNIVRELCVVDGVGVEDEDCFQQTWREIAHVHVCFFMLNLTFWVSLSQTNRCDPGYIDVDLRNPSLYESVIQKVKSYKEDVEKSYGSHLTMLAGIRETILTFSQLCHVCKLARHARSKHCFKCRRSNAVIVFASFAACGFLVLSFVILICIVLYFKTGLTFHEWMKRQKNQKATIKSILHLMLNGDSSHNSRTNYLENIRDYFCYRANKMVKLDVVLREI